MNDILWLLTGNALFWLGIGAYVLFLGIRQNRLDRDIKHLEILNNDNNEE